MGFSISSWFWSKVTSRNVYYTLILGNVLGILLPLVKLVVPGKGTRYYMGYLAFNLIALIASLVLRRRAISLIQTCVTWLQQPSDQYARRVTFSFGFVIIFSYYAHIYLGCWFPGISGWVEPRDSMAVASPVLEEANATENDLAMLNAAINPQNAKYFDSQRYLQSNAMVLHFRNGEQLPANMELTNIVFPHILFRVPGSFRYTDALGQTVQHTLAHRRLGQRFLLPESIAYPNHSVFQKVDYTNYPPADELVKISFWKVIADVNPSRPTRVVSASKECELVVN